MVTYGSDLTLVGVTPKGNLGLVADHSTRQSPKNIEPLVEQSISGTIDEEFVVLNYQPTINLAFVFRQIYKIYKQIKKAIK